MIQEKNDIDLEIEPLTWKFWKKRRYIIVIMAFLGFVNIYTLRVNLSVAIVAMTENRTIYNENGTVQGYEQYFSWSSTEQGFVLSSFFIGYFITQIPGGYIGAKFGGHLIFGIGVFVTAVLTLLTPIAAVYGGISIVVLIRIIEGIFEGVTYPCIHAIWSKWAPPLERSRMATIGFAGSHFGTTIAMPICGILASTLGWESLFYFFGIFACIWYLGWTIIVRQSPAKDKHISEDELKYIQRTLNVDGVDNCRKIKYPWKSIFTSKPVYAIGVSNFCENWGFFTLLTQLPRYLKDTMGFELNNVGYLSALPYLTMSCMLFVAGYLADYVQVKGWLNTSQVRKYFNCGAFLGQAIFLLLAGFVLNPFGSILCITIAVGLGAFAMCGFIVNHLDLAPRYASVLMGITGILGILPGPICPLLTGYIVRTGSIHEWRIIFYISSGLYLIGTIVYWCWSSGELQPWAKYDDPNNSTRANSDGKMENSKPSDFAYTNEMVEMEK